MLTKYKKDDPICIIGAGPGGLSTAYFLQDKGYTDVTILEKAEDVGGLCRTFNFKGRSFDIGANYLTPSYRTIMKMARKIGAKMYAEKGPIAYNPETQTYTSVYKMAVEGTSFWTFTKCCINYITTRLKLSSVFSDPSNEKLNEYPKLMVSFKQWLANNNLLPLQKLFEIPITMMGYGQLDEIPAPYALRYITVGTFITMVAFGGGLPFNYPKRFVYGFQRFWERISWDMNVITGVTIKKVNRVNGDVDIQFDVLEQQVNSQVTASREMKFKALIIATPLSDDVLREFLEMTPAENELFSKVEYNPFGITTIAVEPLKNNYRVFHIFPLNPKKKPAIFAHQFPENPLLTFYTSLEYNKMQTNEEWNMEKQEVLDNVNTMVLKLETTTSGTYTTYDKFPYFPHVSTEDFAAGFYKKLEAIQGENHTYYSGGLMSFELIEPIALYSKYLVNKFF